MNRRGCLFLFGAFAMPSCWPAYAQGTKRRPLVAGLCNVTKEQIAPNVTTFMDGMRDLGWIEGQNFEAVFRFAGHENSGLPALASELIRANPNLILALDPDSAAAAHSATHSVPIVSALLVDPVGLGLVATYAHPGGNLTGMVVAVEGLSGKQLELAAELMPGATVLGVLVNPTNATSGTQRQEIEAAAATKAIRLIVVEARARADLDSAFETLTKSGVQGVIGMRDGMLIANAAQIAQLATQSRLPSIFGTRDQVVSGGLIGYGVNLNGNYRRAAYFVDKILKGADPSDLPLEFPTQLEMVLNLKTAKELRLDIPPSLLARADEVIE
jgi:putative ABC transport system substrate-binding protein